MPDGAPNSSPDRLVQPPPASHDQGRQRATEAPQVRGRRLYHAIFGCVSPFFRRRRMRAFAEAMGLRGGETILDLGGGPSVWLLLGMPSLRVTLLNPEPPEFSAGDAQAFPHLVQIPGDATRLDFASGEFEIVFSNSVIEHLHRWENQQQFAREAMRVAGTTGRLWIQTPARSFFVEPHFLTIGLHWLPKSWQLRLLPWLSGWGWTRRPSRAMTQAWLDEIRLLTEPEMRQLFPGCEIQKEKFLGVWTKSFIAVRRQPPADTVA